MSWYFLGGFSAYLIVPSGRWRNHSGCSRDVRVVRRALEGDVEGDVDPVPRAAASRRSKSSSVPRAGWTAVCPPSGPPMAHGLPGSFGPGGERVVRPLAEGPADRVDRRQVEDVEAHAGDVGQALLHVAEGAVPAGLGGRRAGEELVPGAEPGPLAVHPDAEHAVERRAGRAVGVPGHDRRERRLEGRLVTRPAASPCSMHVGLPAEPDAVGRRRPGRPSRGSAPAPSSRSLSTSWPASTRLPRSRASRRTGRSRPGPCTRRSPARSPGTRPDQRSLTAGRHRHLGPARRPRLAVADDGGQDLVPVGVDVGLDRHVLADRAAWPGTGRHRPPARPPRRRRGTGRDRAGAS